MKKENNEVDIDYIVGFLIGFLLAQVIFYPPQDGDKEFNAEEYRGS